MIWWLVFGQLAFDLALVIWLLPVAYGHRQLMSRVRHLEEDMPLPDKWQAPDIDTESDDVP